jgi:hypothetical protein
MLSDISTLRRFLPNWPFLAGRKCKRAFALFSFIAFLQKVLHDRKNIHFQIFIPVGILWYAAFPIFQDAFLKYRIKITEKGANFPVPFPFFPQIRRGSPHFIRAMLLSPKFALIPPWIALYEVGRRSF